MLYHVATSGDLAPGAPLLQADLSDVDVSSMQIVRSVLSMVRDSFAKSGSPQAAKGVHSSFRQPRRQRIVSHIFSATCARAACGPHFFQIFLVMFTWKICH